jgi:hypothetical protein
MARYSSVVAAVLLLALIAAPAAEAASRREMLQNTRRAPAPAPAKSKSKSSAGSKGPPGKWVKTQHFAAAVIFCVGVS